MRDPSHPTAYACVRSHPGGTTTICNRVPDKDEFLFEDGDHAVDFYLETPRLKVCGECAIAHSEKKAREMGSSDPGVAARGVGSTQ